MARIHLILMCSLCYMGIGTLEMPLGKYQTHSQNYYFGTLHMDGIKNCYVGMESVAVLHKTNMKLGAIVLRRYS